MLLSVRTGSVAPGEPVLGGGECACLRERTTETLGVVRQTCLLSNINVAEQFMYSTCSPHHTCLILKYTCMAA